MAKYENGHFYQLPKNLHKVVSSTYQFAVLSYLLQCENEGEAFPSYSTMAQGLMSRWEAIQSVKRLVAKGYITKQLNNYHSNIYHIDIDKLVSDTNQSAIPTSNEQVTTKVTSNHTSKPHLPPSKPHLPPVVSGTYPNNTKVNNTKEQKEGIRIISSSFNKNNFLTPQKAEDNYGIGRKPRRKRFELPPALKTQVEQKENAIKTLERKQDGEITSGQHRKIVDLVDEAITTGKLAELLVEEVHSEAKAK